MSPIANMLTQLKNAQAVGHETVTLPYSSIKLAIAEILREKGFIGDIERKNKPSFRGLSTERIRPELAVEGKKNKKTEFPCLTIRIKYKDGVGAINGIKFVSKPSRRIYARKSDLKPVRSGYGVAVISTSKGLMTGDKARKAGLGGEILFEVW